MALTVGKRKPPRANRHRQDAEQENPRAPAAASAQLPREIGDTVELPSREALLARLETQRAELVRAMSCVGDARRAIEQHLAKPPFGGALPGSPDQHQLYRQRVLEDLNDAGDALRAAYPMLERIAQALAVDEILREHAAMAVAASEGAGAASKAKP